MVHTTYISYDILARRPTVHGSRSMCQVSSVKQHVVCRVRTEVSYVQKIDIVFYVHTATCAELSRAIQSVATQIIYAYTAVDPDLSAGRHERVCRI